MSLVYGAKDGSEVSSIVRLASIDSFIKFAVRCEKELQQAALGHGAHSVGADLLCRLVDQVGALKVGEYFREQAVTGKYAHVLLDSYMLRAADNAEGRRKGIVRALLQEFPSHDFHLDFHMCEEIGLVVREMGEEESRGAQHITGVLDLLAAEGLVCPEVSDDRRMPYITLCAQGKHAE